MFITIDFFKASICTVLNMIKQCQCQLELQHKLLLSRCTSMCSCFYSRLTATDWREEMKQRRFPWQKRHSLRAHLQIHHRPMVVRRCLSARANTFLQKAVGFTPSLMSIQHKAPSLIFSVRLVQILRNSNSASTTHHYI